MSPKDIKQNSADGLQGACVLGSVPHRIPTIQVAKVAEVTLKGDPCQIVSAAPHPIPLAVLALQENFAFVLDVILLNPWEGVGWGLHAAAPVPHMHTQGETPSPNTEIPAEDPDFSPSGLATDHTGTQSGFLVCLKPASNLHANLQACAEPLASQGAL